LRETTIGRPKRSKKPSGARSKPLSEETFFLDSGLGRTVIAEALRAKGLTVVVHDDVFAQGTPDSEWLPNIGSKGWIVLTKDTRIRYRTNEREALLRAHTRTFVLRSGNLTGQQMADAFMKALPKIEAVLRDREAPFIAGVSVSGNVTMLFE
jgi:hypothetical protein